jgi:hypothetical protein
VITVGGGAAGRRTIRTKGVAMMSRRRGRLLTAIVVGGLPVLAMSLLLVACGGSTSSTTSPAAVSPSPSAALTQADVVAFVQKAVAYADQNGKEAALAAFSDPNGEFVDGELYIFAYDYSGKNLAHGQDPTLVGRQLMGLTDPQGKPIIKEFVGIAKKGDGWLAYCWANPAHDNRVESKLSYITRVDDTWLLGSGFYTGPISTPGAASPSTSPVVGGS